MFGMEEYCEEFGRRIILIMCVLICAGAVYECGKAQIFLGGRKDKLKSRNNSLYYGRYR